MEEIDNKELRAPCRSGCGFYAHTNPPNHFNKGFCCQIYDRSGRGIVGHGGHCQRVSTTLSKQDSDARFVEIEAAETRLQEEKAAAERQMWEPVAPLQPGINLLPRKCVLWATFRAAHFDAFYLDGEALNELKGVIFEAYPFMSTRYSGHQLHMTTNYPGIGMPRELGVDKAGWESMGRSFCVQLRVTEFFVSPDMRIASVPIAGIDTPVMFSP